MYYILNSLLLINLINYSLQTPQLIPIGSIFTSDDNESRQAFLLAINLFNERNNTKFKLEPIVDIIDKNEPFIFTQKLCNQLKAGIFAFVTPISGDCYETLLSYSNTFQLPVIQAGFSVHNAPPVLTEQLFGQQPKFTIFVEPHYLTSIYQLADMYSWSNLIYLYDSNQSLNKLQFLLSLLNSTRFENYEEYESIKNQNTDQFVEKREMHLKAMKRIRTGVEGFKFIKRFELADKESIKHVILDCDYHIVRDLIMHHVNDIYMGRRNYHFLLSSLIFDQNFIQNGHLTPELFAINITGIKILDFDFLNETKYSFSNSPVTIMESYGANKLSKNVTARKLKIEEINHLTSILLKWAKLRSNNSMNDSFDNLSNGLNNNKINKSTIKLNDTLNNSQRTPQHLNIQDISIKAALMFDSVNLLGTAFERIFNDKPLILNGNFGIEKNYVKKTKFKLEQNASEKNCIIFNDKPTKYYTKIQGLSGYMEFDKETGSRINYSLNAFQTVLNNRLINMGSWSSEANSLVSIQKSYQRTVQLTNIERNITYIVASILEEPFLMIKNNSKNKLDGNDRFEGYCKDLADLIADRMNINYEIRLVKDKKYGGIDRTSPVGWSGLVGELIKREADLAIAPLTITSARERVIDFTKPFLSLGISIMIKKPAKKNPDIFSFLSPLSPDIWYFILISYLAVSSMIFIVSRISPNECRVEEQQTTNGQMITKIVNEFTFCNSAWFVLGSFMMQGVDICPRSYAARVAASCWWFFTLIIISSYTANLAAFLTVERMATPINSADDLAKQTEVEYGVLKDSSTQEFFRNSKIQVYSRMWEFMNSRPHVFVDTYAEGVKRVRESKGKYAFLMESTQNEYTNERLPCDTIKVGKNLDSKGFGIATPLNSPLSHLLNIVVLALTESGELTRLEQKWWLDKSQCRNSESKESLKKSLTLYNVAGCFYILIVGLIIALLVSLCELVKNRCKWCKKKV